MRDFQTLFCVFLFICFKGFLIYFGYGLWHSEERQRLLQGTPDGATGHNHSKSSQEVGVGKEQESFVCQEKL